MNLITTEPTEAHAESSTEELPSLFPKVRIQYSEWAEHTGVPIRVLQRFYEKTGMAPDFTTDPHMVFWFRPELEALEKMDKANEAFLAAQEEGNHKGAQAADGVFREYRWAFYRLTGVPLLS